MDREKFPMSLSHFYSIVDLAQQLFEYITTSNRELYDVPNKPEFSMADNQRKRISLSSMFFIHG